MEWRWWSIGWGKRQELLAPEPEGIWQRQDRSKGRAIKDDKELAVTAEWIDKTIGDTWLIDQCRDGNGQRPKRIKSNNNKKQLNG